ncbi:hypothetical protein G7047_19370 [Diaphorobacter sp. HDW4A]|uniref:hypothetical protein n=1 Tax=Diaphorobacter sp. HDW4A TaxID=2714924 RepID=UPI00140A9CE9|nr:hypothetical protein [Diaphorobacter sp. HDW4A]QIL81836.1 hypothetical protein G7047_19370 [Diaphorobacter sp. HDW4A]
MANQITEAAAMLWRTISKKGGWWSAYRLAREWTPVLSLADIETHLIALWKCGYLAAEFTKRDGSVYAFTVGCIPLPDEQLPAALLTNEFITAKPPRPDLMSSNYEAPEPNYRDGAMDFATHPSLHQGQRFAFKGIANA